MVIMLFRLFYPGGVQVSQLSLSCPGKQSVQLWSEHLCGGVGLQLQDDPHVHGYEHVEVKQGGGGISVHVE